MLFKSLTPSAVANCCCLKGSVPYWSNPLFLIFDTENSKNKKKMILLSSTLTFRRCGGGWCHPFWFLLFSMCYSLHVAVNVCINCFFLHFFTHLPRSLRRRICTKIGTEGRLADVINCDNLWQSVKGFGFCSWPKFAIPHWLSQSPLTQCWRYRAARDSKFFTHDYTPPKPHFSTRVPIAYQLHELANKLSQK